MNRLASIVRRVMSARTLSGSALLAQRAAGFDSCDPVRGIVTKCYQYTLSACGKFRTYLLRFDGGSAEWSDALQIDTDATLRCVTIRSLDHAGRATGRPIIVNANNAKRLGWMLARAASAAGAGAGPLSERDSAHEDARLDAVARCARGEASLFDNV